MAFVKVPTVFRSTSARTVAATTTCPMVAPSYTSRRIAIKAVTTEVASNNLYQQYLKLVEPARQEFMNRRALQEILAADNEALTLAFLIYMTARGVRIAEPVEGWIRRAGARCLELGLTEQGNFLVEHAVDEADHQCMYASDTRKLTARWNIMYPGNKMDAERLLSSRYLNPGELEFINLHEDIIKSTEPYMQIAVESEIERLSVIVLPKLFRQIEKSLGDSIRNDLSFFLFHMDADVEHSAENEEQLIRLFATFPSAVDDIARAGEQALRAYGNYLDDCLVLAHEKADSVSTVYS